MAADTKQRPADPYIPCSAPVCRSPAKPLGGLLAVLRIQQIRQSGLDGDRPTPRVIDESRAEREQWEFAPSGVRVINT